MENSEKINVMKKDTELLQQAMKAFAGMDDQAFDLSIPYWESRSYTGGEL